MYEHESITSSMKEFKQMHEEKSEPEKPESNHDEASESTV